MEEAHADLALEAVEAPGTTEQQNESFTTLDYVRELYLNSEEQKKCEAKKMRFMKAAFALLSVLTAVFVLSCVLVVPALLRAANEASAALSVVRNVDVEGIVENVDALALQANDAFAQVGDAVEMFNDLDIDSLNATIGELKQAVTSFSELDVATLNEAIINLNATMAPLASFFGKR